MNTKRGISPLISWVLLIGFVVGLSLMVGNWVRTQAQTTTENVVTNVESDIRCGDVAFNAALDCTGLKLNITNTGKFSIVGIRVRQTGNTEPYQLVIPVNELKTQDLSNFNITKDSDIIPIISLKNNDVVCSARKVVVKKC